MCLHDLRAESGRGRDAHGRVERCGGEPRDFGDDDGVVFRGVLEEDAEGSGLGLSQVSFGGAAGGDEVAVFEDVLLQ